MDSECIIWQSPADEISEIGKDGSSFDSPRAGGKYFITGTAVSGLKKLSNGQKALLTSWLVEQRRNGLDIPTISSTNLVEIQQRRPLRFSEKIARVMQYCSDNISKIGQSLSVQYSEPDDDHRNKLMALTECEDVEDLSALLTLIERMGLIKEDGGAGFSDISPTVSGWLRIEEMQTAAPDVAQAFVAMWFHADTQEAYEKGIRPAIKDCGYEPLRIDNKEHINKIDDEIVAEIRRSRFLIADFTSEPGKPRGGVYFEAGLAMGLKIPVIWTCKASSINDLHFDTRQFNHITWQDPESLYKQLKARIGAVIGDGPLKRPSASLLTSETPQTASPSPARSASRKKPKPARAASRSAE